MAYTSNFPPGEQLFRVMYCHFTSERDDTTHTTSSLKMPQLTVFPRFVRLFSLRAFLTARGHASMQLSFPPAELCTDNAAMIAWTGIEMYEAGWENSFRGERGGEGGGGIRALQKWSLDPDAQDGGILGVEGWVRREGMEGLEGEREKGHEIK